MRGVMKTKKIIIKSSKDFQAETLAWAKKFDRGEKVKPLKGVYFESLEAVRRFLTDARLELWRTIRDKKPNSISELAKISDRNFADVHQDLRILVDVGLVDLRKPKGAKTRALKPVSLVDQLRFEVA